MVCVSIARKIVNRVKTDIKSIQKTFKPSFSIIVFIFFLCIEPLYCLVWLNSVWLYSWFLKKNMYIYKCKYVERETLWTILGCVYEKFLKLSEWVNRHLNVVSSPSPLFSLWWVWGWVLGLVWGIAVALGTTCRSLCSLLGDVMLSARKSVSPFNWTPTQRAHIHTKLTRYWSLPAD